MPRKPRKEPYRSWVGVSRWGEPKVDPRVLPFGQRLRKTPVEQLTVLGRVVRWFLVRKDAVNARPVRTIRSSSPSRPSNYHRMPELNYKAGARPHYTNSQRDAYHKLSSYERTLHDNGYKRYGERGSLL